MPVVSLWRKRMRREWRLRRRADFQRLRQEGQTLRHPLLLLSVLANGTDKNRYGVIVSRQIGNAVTRNRVRRRINESLRMLHPELKPGYDVVVIARSGAAEQPFVELQRTVIEMIRRANLLQEKMS